MSLESASFRRVAVASVPGVVLCAAALVGASPPAGGAVGVSGEIPVHAAGGDQFEADIAMDAAGDHVVTWTTTVDDVFGNIHAQRFSAAGVPLGPETLVNTATDVIQAESQVAMDADGDYVVTWTSEAQDGDGYGVFAQRYAADGTPRGTETLVNTTTAGPQRHSTVAMDADGDYVVAWTSEAQDGDGLGIYSRRYAADGTPRGGETQVNTATVGTQEEPSVAMDADGDYVVAWTTTVPAEDLDFAEISTQRYSADGTPRGGETTVNTNTLYDQRYPSVAMEPDGDHVVAWTSYSGDGTGNGLGVYAQRYDASGAARGGETRVNTTVASDQQRPSVALDADGDYVVTWTSHGQDGDGVGVYAQRYAASGTPVGAEFAVNATAAGFQGDPAAAMDADGDFTLTWITFNQPGNDGVFARRWRGPATADLTVDLADNADPVAVGRRLTYRVRVANLSEESTATGFDVIDAAIGAAAGVQVFVTPPDGATFTSSAGSGWTCGAPGATMTCRQAGAVLAGAEAPDLRLSFTAPEEAGPALSTVKVAGGHPDPIAGNNRAVEQTGVLCAIELTSSPVSAQEAGVMTATVVRRGSNCGSSSVGYETSSGSATAGTDFTDVAGTLEWTDATGDLTFEVPITPDSLDERNEQLRLRLTSPSGALLGTRSLVNGTIADNDAPPRINLTTTTGTASEAGALVEVTARLSAASGQTVTVTLAKAGTATNGSDYFTEHALTIPAGHREATFTVEVVEDAVDEPNETAVISLSNPVATTIGTQKTYRLTITDND